MQSIRAAGLSLCVLVACVHQGRVTSLTQGPAGGTPILRIAVGPATRFLAPLIAQELERGGYLIDEPAAWAKVLALHHLGDDSLEKPEGLRALASERVDALLIAVPEGGGAWPKSVRVRLVRTGSGAEVVSFVWRNGSCGLPGSPCDSRAKRDWTTAAEQIAPAVEQSIGSRPEHLIEEARDDTTLVVSGVLFRKGGDCSGFERGARVWLRVHGVPGLCTRAELILAESGEECVVGRDDRPAWCPPGGR